MSGLATAWILPLTLSTSTPTPNHPKNMQNQDTPKPPADSDQTTDGVGVGRCDLLAIFEILTLCAGTPQSLRDEFVHALQRGAKEFRIGGSLGFRGKYWPETNTVSCYPEDMTDRRRAMITDTNGHLAHFARSKANA
jgi:hypothetical protein